MYRIRLRNFPNKCLVLLIDCTLNANTFQKFMLLSMINKWFKSSPWPCRNASSLNLNQRDGFSRSSQIICQAVVSNLSCIYIYEYCIMLWAVLSLAYFCGITCNSNAKIQKMHIIYVLKVLFKNRYAHW